MEYLLPILAGLLCMVALWYSGRKLLTQMTRQMTQIKPVRLRKPRPSPELAPAATRVSSIWRALVDPDHFLLRLVAVSEPEVRRLLDLAKSAGEQVGVDLVIAASPTEEKSDVWLDVPDPTGTNDPTRDIVIHLDEKADLKGIFYALFGLPTEAEREEAKHGG